MYTSNITCYLRKSKHEAWNCCHYYFVIGISADLKYKKQCVNNTCMIIQHHRVYCGYTSRDTHSRPRLPASSPLFCWIYIAFTIRSYVDIVECANTSPPIPVFSVIQMTWMRILIPYFSCAQASLDGRLY